MDKSVEFNLRQDNRNSIVYVWSLTTKFSTRSKWKNLKNLFSYSAKVANEIQPNKK